jgi:hypothetical protein
MECGKDFSKNGGGRHEGFSFFSCKFVTAAGGILPPGKIKPADNLRCPPGDSRFLLLAI